jgi:hypothetical protein
VLQEVAADIQPKLQTYLVDSDANGTVTVDVQYAQLPPFTVSCFPSIIHVHMLCLAECASSMPSKSCCACILRAVL